MTEQELKAMQDAYWAMPYAVRWCDSHFSSTSKFETYDEAFAYVQYQFKRVKAQCATTPRGVSWHGAYLWQGYIETPEGRTPLNYLLLVDVLSN